MRTVHSKCPLPVSFSRFKNYAKLFVHEFDVFPHKHGRLAAKTLIFRNNKDLSTFWDLILGHKIGPHTLGVVNKLNTSHVRFGKMGEELDAWREVDPRFFCFVGLILGHLTHEIISHEAVHVGFAYAKRVKRRVFSKPGELEEEEIAYPAGRYMAAATYFIKSKGIAS